MTAADIVSVAPEMAAGILAMLLLLIAPLIRRRPEVAYATGICGLLVLLIVIALFDMRPASMHPFGGTLAVDHAAVFMKIVVACVGIIALLSAWDDLRDLPRTAEAPALIAFGTLGAMLLAGAQNVVVVAVAMGILAGASYALVGIDVRGKHTQEAAIKLFTFGAVCGAVMLFGFAFLYGLSGALDFPLMRHALVSAPALALAYASILIFAGYGFEAAIAPFAQWVPDVYQGARTSITLWLSLAPKLAGLAIIARTFSQAYPTTSPGWVDALGSLAVLTMLWANIAAYAQTDVKRLLAYSSIAHAGFMLAAIAVIGRTSSGLPTFLFYAAGYAAMNGGAFAVQAIVERRFGTHAIEGFRGLGARSPWLAAAMTLALLSLAGFPPLIGFAIKVAIIRATFEGGAPWLGFAVAFNTVLALGYYIRPIAAIYTGHLARKHEKHVGNASPIAVAVTVGATVGFGLLPVLIAR